MFASSGELSVVRYALGSSGSDKSVPVVVFAVGANQGLYASMVLDTMGDRCQIYCFEPSKDAFALLQDRVGSRLNVALHHFGFGKAEEQGTLFSNAPGSGLASIYHRRLDHFGVTMDMREQITLRTLDGFCAEHGIDRIDLLKLDVEGHEFDVMRGGKRLIESQFIHLIQFEFGGCNIDARLFFQDFFYLLNPFYTLHRVVRDGWVPISEYQERQELFLTTNFLAISRKFG